MTTRPFKKQLIPAVTKYFCNMLAERKPRRLLEITRMGFEMRELGQGKFRRVYEVLGHECIVKVPRNYTAKSNHELWRDPKHHAQIEVETLRMIMRDDKYEHLRRYVPQVYYSCLETGLVVMPVYRDLMIDPGIQLQNDIIGQMFRDTLKKWTADYTHQNIMLQPNGFPVVVDLGY